MTEELATVAIQVTGEHGSDEEELAHLTYALRHELSDLDVEDVELAVGGTAPPGSKGVELMALGTLIVKLVRTAGGLPNLVGVIASWIERTSARSVRIDMNGDVLEVTGLSSSDQRALIEAWLERQKESQ